MSTEPGRVTLSGEQILAAKPDTGVARATLTGEQILAEQPTPPVRVTSGLLEVLVAGAFIPPGRATLAGEQILAATPAEPLRVSASLIEVLVAGAFIPGGRVSTTGEQILARTPGEPLRVSASLIELLVGNDNSLAPARLFGAAASATVSTDYPSVDAPQSELQVSHLSQASALPVEYILQGSFGRAAQVQLSASVPSAILEWEPAARAYAMQLQATVPSRDLPDPALPQSDLFVSHVSASAGVQSEYPDKGLVQSQGRVGRAGLSATLPYPDLPDPALPQSDLFVSRIDQCAAIASTPPALGSDLWVTSVRQEAALVGAYPTAEMAYSDLYVSRVDQQVAVATSYPPGYSAMSRLHGAHLSASVPAGWLGDYVTQLRAHSVRLQATLPARAGVYVHPSLVRPSVEVSYLTNCVGYASQDALGGGSAAFVSYLTQQTAIRAAYGEPGPESVVTVLQTGLNVVYEDQTLRGGIPERTPALPICSIDLVFP